MNGGFQTSLVVSAMIMSLINSGLLYAMDDQKEQMVSSTIVYRDHGVLPDTDPKNFEILDFRIGTVKSAMLNNKSRTPSLCIKMSFGLGFDGLKQSSAQLIDNYGDAIDAQKTALAQKQIAAIVNFPKLSVGIPSYFLTLGVVSLTNETNGTVVVVPLRPVADGARIKLLNDNVSSIGQPPMSKATIASFHALDIRVGTVVSTENKLIDFGERGMFSYSLEYNYLKDGIQVLRVFNLAGMEFYDNILGIVTDGEERIPVTLERAMPNGRFLK